MFRWRWSVCLPKLLFVVGFANLYESAKGGKSDQGVIYGIRGSSAALQVAADRKVYFQAFGQNLPKEGYMMTTVLHCADWNDTNDPAKPTIWLKTTRDSESAVFLEAASGLPFDYKYTDFRLCHQNTTAPNRKLLSVSRSDDPVNYLRLLLCAVLLLGSGLCTGLNVAYMRYSYKHVVMIAQRGFQPHKAHAQKILWFRKQSNWLICTLTTANVVFNIIFTTELNHVWNGLEQKLILSYTVPTIILMLLGEGVPQSLCNRYGIVIACRTRFLLCLLMFFFAPFAWPLSKLIDFILGREARQIYSESMFNHLIAIQYQKMSMGGDADILARYVDFYDKLVRDVMTPLEDVFRLNSKENLNTELLVQIVESGYTRIPVYERIDSSRVAFVLNVNDLANKVNISSYTVEEAVANTENHKATMRYALSTMLAEKLMQEMMSGDQHICAVFEFSHSINRVVGVITLEDIIEELFGEIEDDSDFASVNRRSGKHKDHLTLDWFRSTPAQTKLPFTVNQHLFIIQNLLLACPSLSQTALGFDIHGLRHLLSIERFKTTKEKLTISTDTSDQRHSSILIVVVRGRIIVEEVDTEPRTIEVDVTGDATRKTFVAGVDLASNLHRDLLSHLSCLSASHPLNMQTEDLPIKITSDPDMEYFEISREDMKTVLKHHCLDLILHCFCVF